MISLKMYYKLNSPIQRRTFSKLSYVHQLGSEPLQPLTIGTLLEKTARRFPDHDYVVSRHQKQRMTFKEVLEQADKLAAGLQSLDLNKGDRFGIWAPNISEWVVAKMACARIGLILVALNPGYQAREMEYCINKTGMKGILCPGKLSKYNFYDILNTVTKAEENEPGKLNNSAVPTLKSIITISDQTFKGTFNYREILDVASETSIKSVKNNQHLIQPDDPFSIQFTSGTTGQPKAALASHFQVINNSFYIGKRNELDERHKICVQVPLFHAFGITITTMASLNWGAAMILPSPLYNSQENFRAITEEKCTAVYGTPTMYVDLINVKSSNENQNVKLEVAVVAGSPCSPELFKKIKKHLQVKRIKSIYGLTEATAAIFQSLPQDEDEYKVTATVGHLGDHLEVKVIDENNQIVPLGTPGELCVRGYSTLLEYWGDKEKTAEIKGPDGWLRTGDQFVLQDDGYGRIVGRLKDMIIRGGENIFPKEIEDVLHKHPDVLEAHVIGVAHVRLGEEVCACVRLKEGAKLTLDDISSFCKGKIASFKIPRQLQVMSQFPKTASGKIQKHILKQQIEAKS